jgi:DNA-directed RNA polymerase specialized sigma subunit
MAGIPASSGEQQRRKQTLLDFFRDHIGTAYTADELAKATGMSEEDVKIAVEALAYEHEVAKERTEGGIAVYQRKG